jgi:hypothetical protein
MALITPRWDEGMADDILSVAEAHFESALKALNSLTDEVEDGARPAPSDVQKTARDFRAAVQTLFDERKRIESQRKRDAGIVHDYALDLDAARAEVGGLLDRLRAAGGAGEVPG